MAQSTPFSLNLGPGAADASVVVEFEQVASTPIVRRPRRARLERVEPRWFALSTAAGIIGLVLLSVAAGTVSVAPPPAPTPLPGQPTPTAAPPSLRVGNLLIQAPVARQAPRAEPTAPTVAVAGVAVADETVTQEPAPAPADSDNGDGGGFRLILPFFQAPPPPRPTAIARRADPPTPTPVPAAPLDAGADEAAPPVVPVPSPAAAPLNGRTSAPRPGSALEDALRTASIANDEFNRGLHEPVPHDTQP